ncbi:olfactory receptor 1020-like [Malaclemys terrapin pileata]|uniref:olfactory receptor 1020-like n=1 Tax=Malaclemys terrapin pileata TaxID=2991368 RepID=UPI0023A8A3E1|nr:olfactory receptor 1020-like [Malaclemys terrapin pileata]
MAHMQWENETSITKFILLGFGNLNEVQILLFVLFLVIYILTMAGNLLMVALVVYDQHLHTPMYFFLGNLSFLETCYTSVISPRLLAGFLVEDRTISFRDCITQLFFFGALASIECFLLAVMAYDRYLAICNPLSYKVMMNFRFCLQLVFASWITGFSGSALVVGMVPQLNFCGPNEINNFFCDMAELLKLSCARSPLVEMVILVSCSLTALIPFLFIIVSYILILSAIWQIASSAGRQKAFSTCTSHLLVVSLYYGTLIIMYMAPSAEQSPGFHKTLSLMYTAITPMFNPIIYSLRNQEVKGAFGKVVMQNLGMI